MGAFSDLLVEAKTAGAEALVFHVDLDKNQNGTPGAWEARARHIGVPHVATGRSGEEALRELVTFLKAIQK